MGRSGGKKKKGAASNPLPAAVDNQKNLSSASSSSTASTSALPNGGSRGFALDPSVFLNRAHELKEEGNRRFQAKDYAGALDQYDLAIKLTPPSHPDRAVFHSNRAACLMQMRPVDHHAVAAECSLALQAQPGFPRALLRRARALEALGKHELALMDAQSLLASDPTHRDAIEIVTRLQSGLSRHELLSRPSPAALGASAVRGAPIAGIGPCLPSRPVPKKPSSSSLSSSPLSPSGRPEKTPLSSETQDRSLPNGTDAKMQQSKAVSLKPFKENVVASAPVPPSSSSLLSSSFVQSNSSMKENSRQLTPALGRGSSAGSATVPITHMRQLKLVYDHDIRLAEMPAKCSFRVLRDIVTKRFPSSKSVLVKYKDNDGDLVTITSTAELRLAEACVDQITLKESTEEKIVNKDDKLQVLRLHLVEVSPEQEPSLVEEEEEGVVDEEKPAEFNELVKHNSSLSNSSNGEPPLDSERNGVTKIGAEEDVLTEKAARDKECDHAQCKEAEFDDWLLEFAQLFRTNIGIDPDAHLDLHEIGMDLCSEALEETVTSEQAQRLFDMAAAKFQEVAALAFFNWGNVYMCAARKRIPLDDHAPKEVMSAQLQSAYDWVRERYTLAGEKYEESLRIKPDFYEGLLALGQQHFENAKLQWSFAVANKIDLKSWDSSETIGLFNSAEEKMKVATEMWEKFEEQRANDLKESDTSKKTDLLRKSTSRVSNMDGQSSLDAQGGLSSNEAAEQAAVMRSQIHLFWGNMLFERSQVEFRLGISGWKKNLDAAVERFKLAGASDADIAVVMKNHSSNEVGLEFDEKKVTDLININETSIKDEDKHVLES